MQMVTSEKWLNGNAGGILKGEYWNKDGINRRFSIEPPEDLGWNKGLFLTAEQKNNRSIQSSKRIGPKNSFYGKTHSDENKRKQGERSKKIHTGRKRSIETRKKISEANTGKTHSDETRKKLSIINTGNKHSETSKQKMSESRKGIPKSDAHKSKIKESNKNKTWTCPHCKMTGGHGMFRWHFDNCKHKDT